MAVQGFISIYRNKRFKVNYLYMKSNQLRYFDICPLVIKEVDISIDNDFFREIYSCQLLRN